MALKGRIEEFGLPDLLQLIVQGQKRGTIMLSDDVDEVLLSLKEARVVRVEHLSRPQESELASRLATLGVINGAQLGRVLKQHAETGEKMARILIEGGYAAMELVKSFATLQAVDTLFDTFMWKSGSYEFEEKDVELPPPWFDPIATDYLLMRGIELVDELPWINELVPSTSMKVLRLRDLPNGPHAEHASLVADLDLPGDETGISDQDRQMFEICRPGLHVKTVLDRMPSSRFEASRALANLIKGGYVRLGASE